MIPLNNNGDNNGDVNVSVDRYTEKDIYYNYLNYSIDKVESDNPEEQVFLYTSQVIKDNNKTNKFVLTYIPEVEDNNTIIPEHFELNPVKCVLDVLMIPSSLPIIDDKRNITDSKNDLMVYFNSETTQDKELTFKQLIFQNGLSDNFTLFITNCLSTLETLILNDNYLDTICLNNIPNLKYISRFSARDIVIQNCPKLKDIEIVNSQQILIKDMNGLHNLLIHDSNSVYLSNLNHIKSCIGLNVHTLQLEGIHDMDVSYYGWVREISFKSTPQIHFMGHMPLLFKNAYFNSLDPEQSLGSQQPTRIRIQNLYIPHIFYHTDNYYPLFPTSNDITFIQNLHLVNIESFYNSFDLDDSYYHSKYDWQIVEAIYFETFLYDGSDTNNLKRIIKHLFNGDQLNPLYLFTPRYISAGTLN